MVFLANFSYFDNNGTKSSKQKKHIQDHMQSRILKIKIKIV